MGIIRLLLALAVLFEHAFLTFGPNSFVGLSFMSGEIAVQSFYIISGFYISYILNEKYIGVNNSYKLFLTNRLLRLFPIYWFVLALTIAASLFYCFYTNFEHLGYFELYVDFFKKMDISSLIYLLFTNLFIIGQDTILFLGLNTETGNLFFTQNFKHTNPQLYQFMAIPQAWTISIELLFYILAPFILKRNYKIILILIL